MDRTLLLGLAACVVGIVLLLVVAADMVLARRTVNRALRQATLDDPFLPQVRERELAVPWTQRIAMPALHRVGALVRWFTPTSVITRLDRELGFAAASAGWDGERLLAVKAFTSLALGVAALVASLLVGLSRGQVLLLVLIGAAVGYYLPEWIVRSRSATRQGAIRRALPDALDLLSITVEAGLGFDAALDRVSRQIRGPLGGELYRVVQEMRLGTSRADAMRALGTRTDIPELKSFVMAMIQADTFGVSIANVLQIQANEMRLKRRQRAEEEAQKLPVKIIFPLIICIFPALFVVLLGPAAIQIYDNLLNQ